MNGNNIIAKKNELVSKASYKLDYYEHLIFLSALSEVDSRTEIDPKKRYQINLPDLAKLANIENENPYPHFKRAVQKLKKRELSIPEKDGSITVTGFIHAYNYHNGEAKLSVSFSPEIIPYISHIRESFVAYKFKQIAQFKCSYAIRIYELLIQNIDISTSKILSLDDLRSLFKLGKSYSKYSNIKSRVITPAVKDINTYSDINIIYKEIRSGRKVTALEFHIESLEPRPTTKRKLEENARPGETYEDVKQRLRSEEKKKPFKSLLFNKILNNK